MKYVIFHDAADASYCNTVDNFRGAYATEQVVTAYFSTAAGYGAGVTGGYDAVAMACTNGEEDRAVEELCAAMTKNQPVQIIADDVNSVYACQNITAVNSITLGATGNFKTVVALTSATNIEKADSGKVFMLTQASAHSHTLPTAADAGAGWNAKFILKTAGGNAVKVIPDSTEDTLIGLITSADNSGGESAESGVDEIVWVASTAVAGDWVEVTCDGTNFYVSGMQHDNDHMTIS